MLIKLLERLGKQELRGCCSALKAKVTAAPIHEASDQKWNVESGCCKSHMFWSLILSYPLPRRDECLPSSSIPNLLQERLRGKPKEHPASSRQGSLGNKHRVRQVGSVKEQTSRWDQMTLDVQDIY